MLFPFYWMFITSIKPNRELYNARIMPLIVHQPTLKHYVDLLTQTNFLTWTYNMAHHHPAGVTRQAPGRFRGNARAAFEDRLPRLPRVGQDRASTWTTTWYRSPGVPGSSP
jgi:hypothetical protein